MYDFNYNSLPDYKNYIAATQNGVVRLLVNDASQHVEGVCTNRLLACLAIIIISQNKKRISLIHTDLMVSEKAILDEIRWVNQPCSLYIVKGNYYSKPSSKAFSSFVNTTFPRLKKAIHQENHLDVILDLDTYAKPTWAVAVDRKGEIVLFDNMDVDLGTLVDFIEFRHTINIINSYFTLHYQAQKYHELDLQYNESAWTPCAQLIEGAETLMNDPSKKEELIKNKSLYEDIEEYFRLKKTLTVKAESLNKEGVQKFKTKDYSSAINVFEQVCQHWEIFNDLKPIATSHYNLASTHIENGSPEVGIFYLKKTLSLLDLAEKNDQTLLSIEKAEKKLNSLLTDKEKMQYLIEKIQARILTSHNLVNRIKNPYYYNQADVPEILISFKQMLSSYRETASILISKLPDFKFSDMPETLTSAKPGTFAHRFIGSMVVANFGLGDCAECAINAAIQLLEAGFYSMAFVSINFTHASLGMETGHQFVVANLPKMPNRSNEQLTLVEFLKLLPKDALVLDAFLALCFEAGEPPDSFYDYLNAYGGEAEVVECIHFFNFSNKSLGSYREAAKQIIEQIPNKTFSLSKNGFTAEDKTIVNNPSIIEKLNSKTSLRFNTIIDGKDTIDAIAQLNTIKDTQTALLLRRSLNGYGTFFQRNGMNNMALEKVNTFGGHSNLQASVSKLGKQ